MKQNLNSLLTFALVLFCISACKKDSKTAPGTTTKTKADYLTQGAWVTTGERVSTDNGAYVDTYGNYQSCFKDNRISFSANGTYINDEGPTKCSASSPQTVQQGTWSINSAQTIFSTTPNGGTKTDVTILQLDDTTLKLLQEYTSGGHSYKSEGTWGHP